MINPNDPSNPCPHVNGDFTVQHDVYQGLTKREYFAAMAMQGYIASGLMDGCVENTLAMRSVTAADALIAELNK